MATDDSEWPSAVYISAVVTYVVLLSAGLIANVVVFQTNLFVVRREFMPDRLIYFIWTWYCDQIAVALPSIANILFASFAVIWFAYVALDGQQVVICSRNRVPGPGSKIYYPVPNPGN